MLCGFTVFSAVVLSKFGDRIYHGVYNRLFKPSKGPADTSETVTRPAKKVDTAQQQEQQQDTPAATDESGIPPEVDAQADSILKGIQKNKQRKEEPQFYRDSAKTKDTSNLNF